MSIDLKFTELKGASRVAKFSPQPSALSPQPSALSPQPSALSKVIFKLLCVFLFIFFANSSISATKNCTYKYRFPYHTGGGIYSWTNYFNSLAEACSNQFPGGYIGSVEDIPRPSASDHFCIYYSDVWGWGWAPLNTSEELYTCDTTSTLTLSPAPNQKDPRPLKAEGKDGKSSYELIAKVMEGSTPKAGVVVTFAVEVEPNTGGHDHHNASRPKGLVNGKLTASGVTEANGEIKVTFQASEFAGTHVVAAACSTCTNTSATKNVDVKVPGLIELQGDYSRGAKYELIGSTPKHQGNHFFAPEAKDALRDLLPIFASFDWGVVGVNDSSLKWGGRFDIGGHWNGSHHEHREGKEVDISFYKPFGTISEEARKNVYDELRKSKGVSMPNVLWHLEDNPNTGSRAHFHVYLLGQSFTRTTKY